jgi:hypothetical protein
MHLRIRVRHVAAQVTPVLIHPHPFLQLCHLQLLLLRSRSLRLLVLLTQLLCMLQGVQLYQVFALGGQNLLGVQLF